MAHTHTHKCSSLCVCVGGVFRCAVSDRLGVPPVVTHASMDLWNWALIDADGPMDIENLK